MSDGIFSLPNSPSATSRTAGALGRVWLCVRAWMAQRRRHQALAGLDDWILHDIGVIRDRDFGAGFEADPREAARQFWRL